MSARSWPVNLAHATSMAGGAMFPISFLLLWSRPLAPQLWQAKVSRWLLRLSVCNAAWITALLFVCPFMANLGLWRLSMYSLSLNASLLLTVGAFTLVRGRLSAAADRMYLTLTLLGMWGSTAAIFVLDQVHFSPRLEAALVIAKEQSPFLAVLGALFFFANLRPADVLIKHSLRVVAAVCIGLWTCFFIAETLPHLAARFSAFPLAATSGLAAATIAALLVLFSLIDQAIGRTVDCWILRQPDYRAALRQLWDEMVHADSDPIYSPLSIARCRRCSTWTPHACFGAAPLSESSRTPKPMSANSGSFLVTIPAGAYCRATMSMCWYRCGCTATFLT